MDYAPVITPVRGPDEVGELASLARQALMPRKEHVEQALRMRELLQEAAPGREVAAAHVPAGSATAERQRARPEAVQAASFQRVAAAQANSSTPAESGQLRPRQVPSFADLAPLQPGLQGDLPPGRDGDLLRQVAAEVRALRDDLASMSRMLGYTARTGPEYRGVLQQYDRLDTNVQAQTFRVDSERQDYQDQRRAARADHAQWAGQQADAQQRERQLEVQQAIRAQQAARIAQRQRDLVRALQRAQRQLASVPTAEIPVGLRDAVIGEIYKARYSIAVFGGAMGTAQLSGLAFQTSI
jgi:hypothetical protein